jgi:hypothetical protein
MSQPEPTNDTRAWRPPTWLALLFLAGLVWFSHFFWSSKFGIYEDDYILVEVMMNTWKMPQLKLGYYEAFNQYMQGRPLHFVIGHTIAYATTKPGGTFGVAYLAAFGIQVLNAWLVLLVARRAIGPRLAPLAAAVFALAPADTTHQFLHVCFYVQPSVTFMLLALWAYQKGWRVLSYLPAGLTLLTYETCFLPILLAPLLATEPPRVRRVLAHGVMMGAILLAAFAVRSHYAEARLKDEMSDRSAMLSKLIRLSTVGPATSAEAFTVKPASAGARLADPSYFTGDGLRPLAGAWAILAATVLGAVLLASGTGAAENAPRGQLLRAALAGAAMVVVSYPAALNRDPTALEGRLSSVHIASAPGWALIAGALVGLALSALPRTGRRALWALVALYLGTLAAYHVTVQRDYARGWAEQRRFWGEINRLCPDIDDDVVIVYPYPPSTCAAVEVNSHPDHLLPQRMFGKDPPWKNPPLAIYLGRYQLGSVPRDYAGYDWPEVKVEDGELVFMHWSERKLPMKPGRVIAVYPDGNGRYRRLSGTLDIHGIRLPLRESTAPIQKLCPTALRWQLTPP